jgi:hypothetical protein
MDTIVVPSEETLVLLLETLLSCLLISFVTRFVAECFSQLAAHVSVHQT